MTLSFKPNVRYRMPVNFGPAPGPRQKLDGTPWTFAESGMANVQWCMLAFRSEAAALEKLLPPGFKLNGTPAVYVALGFFRNLYWLAGRGYGMLNVEIPVIYTGKSEVVEGGLCLAIWEGRPDAIMTGREELGFPKLFANIPDVRFQPETGGISSSISWMEHTFCDYQAHGFKEREVQEMRLPGAKGTPIYYKYMPRTGEFGSGGADIAYVTSSAPKPNSEGVQSPIKFDKSQVRRWSIEGGKVTWHRATFEQLPTTCHVVNGIADIPMYELIDSDMIEFTVPGAAVAVNGHRIIE